MWFSDRNSKRSCQSHRNSLRLEQLEKRELLNGSPLPAPQAVNPLNASLAQAVSLAAPLTESLPGYSVPSSIAPLVNKAAAQGWQGSSQLPATSGPLQQALTASKGPMVQIPLVILPNQSPSPSGEGYTPSQLQQAYGFNQIALPAGETFNDAGSGQTIAIIDPLNDPYLRSDVQTFDQTFNIGGAAHDVTSTSFLKVINEDGGSTLPGTDVYDLGMETSLDVEWAHAMAPGANILLVETSSFFALHDVGTAIETAACQPGVSVISMSFGLGEVPTEYYLDNLFTTPAGHQGVSFVASAGDSGSFFAEYPAISPNVLGVGGTTLPVDPSGNPSRAQETTWADGGGGISRTEAEPAYQLGVQSTGRRTGPDLAYDSDPTTGVPVLDTLYGNTVFPGQNRPWTEIGGTSMAAPQTSSLVAVANQLRVAAGEGTLDGANQLLPAIYQIAATDPNAFGDITTGNNGHPAGPGYDFATGFGTPNAQYLVPDLVAAYKTPPAPRTLYWTGDVSTSWDTSGNWSSIDPTVKNVQQSVLPTAADRVVVDLTGATILHDSANYDTISSLTVTAPKVTLDIGSGTLDLAGGGGRGTFRADQNGDVVTMEAGILANAIVTSGTSLATTSDANGNYPVLDAVQLEGTVNADQSGGNNGFVFQNGLILNGTINLGSNKDISSVIGAGYWDPTLGNQDNNPEVMSGSGTIRLGQSQTGDGLQTWGTLATFTIGPGITIVGGGAGSIGLMQQTNFTGGFDFQGTIKANGGILLIQSFGPALYGWSATTMGWTNEGNITASGATLGLLGTWINSGTIGVDARSTILLGDATSGELASDPNAAFDAWSSRGAVTIADGATVYVGGFLTADQYQGAAAIPGVTWHSAADPRVLVGTLDNIPSDNPASHGVLNAAGTPLTIAGGTILGGTVSARSKLQVVAATPLPDINFVGFSLSFASNGGWLDNVINGGTLTDTAVSLTLSNVTNTGTVSGTTAAVIEFLNTWANTGTIKVDGTSSLFLGTPASSDTNFPPTLTDGSPYAWNPAAGSIQVADGATVGLGGLLTTDQFTALSSLPNVSIHLAHDTFYLDGWLDNKPADNPVTGGVLALTSATGSVGMYGGYIAGGSITTTGSTALNIVLPSSGPFADFANVLDGVTNNGTIAVVSNFLELVGNVVNNGTLTDAANESLFSAPGGSLTNNGSMSFVNSDVELQSSVVNHGTITLEASAFIVGFMFAPSDAVRLTNTGTIFCVANSQLNLFGTMTNSGTVSVITTSSAFFGGNYDNTHGTIRVDSTSALELGRSTLEQQNFPTFADGSPYAFDPSKVGTIQIADGAELELGGLMTTDQWNSFASQPGVTVHVAKGLLLFTGWLNNTPADNPVSGGVLAITPATGPMYLSGGYIYHGRITTSSSNDVETSEAGVLDGVKLDGNLNVTGRFGFGKVYVENNMTLNGTIVMPGGFGFLFVGFFDNAADTITGTGTISMGTSSTFQSVVDNLSNISLTIGPGITINAGAQFSYLISEGAQTNVLGTVEDNTASSTLYTYGTNDSTLTDFQNLVNFNGGTLTGGTWEFGGGATWRTYGADITTNAANLSVSGAGTQILDSVFSQGNNALAGLTTNTGHLTVGAGYNLTLNSNLQNAGILEVAGALVVQGNYTQSAGAVLDLDIAGPTVYGSLTVSGMATLAGTLNVVLVNGFTPASGQSYTILTFGARSGDFSAKNGLLFSPTESFAANDTGNTLTLVVVP